MILVAFQASRQRVSVCSSVNNLLSVSWYRLKAVGKVRVVLSSWSEQLSSAGVAGSD